MVQTTSVPQKQLIYHNHLSVFAPAFIMSLPNDSQQKPEAIILSSWACRRAEVKPAKLKPVRRQKLHTNSAKVCKFCAKSWHQMCKNQNINNWLSIKTCAITVIKNRLCNSFAFTQTLCLKNSPPIKAILASSRQRLSWACRTAVNIYGS